MHTDNVLTKHDLVFPQDGKMFSDAKDTWLRKRQFLWWQHFVTYVKPSSSSEINKTIGSKMAISALDVLQDEDWNSIDKIDLALSVVYDWYRKYHKYFWESLGDISEERNMIGYQLYGIKSTLWGMLGIAINGEESVLSGNGSFPKEREQMALDIENGWDGKMDRYEWRECLMEKQLIQEFSSTKWR